MFKASALTAVFLAVSIGSICAVGGSAASITPLSLLPTSIAFWDKEHGLIGTGSTLLLGALDPDCRHSHCQPGTVSVTTDGGRTSRVLVQTPGPVMWVAAARNRQAWAVVLECRRGRCSRLLWHSSDAGARWRVVGPTPFETASFADAEHALGLLSGVIATSDGGRSWHRLPTPCPEHEVGVSLVTPRRGWLLCVFRYGVGNDGKSIYGTEDGGKHWQRLAVATFSAASGGIGLYGYPEGIAFASDGVGVLWESRGTLYLTRDGGRHWMSFPHVSEPEADFGLSAAVVPGRAFALLWRTPVRPIPVRLLATTGAGWRTIRTWISPIR